MKLYLKIFLLISATINQNQIIGSASGPWDALYSPTFNHIIASDPFTPLEIEQFSKNQIFAIEKSLLSDTSFKTIFTFDSSYSTIKEQRFFINKNYFTLYSQRIIHLDQHLRCIRFEESDNLLENIKNDSPAETIKKKFEYGVLTEYEHIKWSADSVIWINDSTAQDFYNSYIDTKITRIASKKNQNLYKGVYLYDKPFEFTIDENLNLIKYNDEQDVIRIIKEKTDSLLKYTHYYIRKYVDLNDSNKIKSQSERIGMIEEWKDNLLVKRTVNSLFYEKDKSTGIEGPVVIYIFDYLYNENQLTQVILTKKGRWNTSTEIASNLYDEKGLLIQQQVWSTNGSKLKKLTYKYNYYSKSPL